MMRIRISTGAIVLFAALLLLLPLKWLLAALLAGSVHELFHYVCVSLLGGNVREICIGSRGVVMNAQPLSPYRQLLCTLAGPIGSLCLLFFARWLPRTAVCGMIHGLFNLLPLLPLDGGRILQILLFTFLSPPRAARVFRVLQRMIYLCLLAVSVLTAMRFSGFLLIPLFFLLPRILFRGTIMSPKHKRYGHDRITEANPADSAKTGTVHRRRI
ncbi:MAG: hypothetical protein E7447_07320 [Ruminococcaceae bacterium]|nr:hypothetical protein [Oscillospiraceae bacterium]